MEVLQNLVFSISLKVTGVRVVSVQSLYLR